MSNSANTESVQTLTTAIAQRVACPRCDARLPFRRSRHPHIDSCGFESYSLACEACGAALAGIIDPYDDALLLTEIAANDSVDTDLAVRPPPPQPQQPAQLRPLVVN